MRKTIVGITSALAMMALGANAAKAECGQISISEMNWASAAVVTAVSKFLLEQGYGCKVKTVPSSTARLKAAKCSLACTGSAPKKVRSSVTWTCSTRPARGSCVSERTPRIDTRQSAS